MANCCSHTPCQELVTVGYLKSFLQLSPCITINDGQGYDACCGTYGGDNYVVTKRYDFHTRVISQTTPSDDKDGFIIDGLVGESSCCGNLSSDDSCIAKSRLTFGRTVLTASTLNASTSYDEPCNPTYSVTKTDTYVREKYECNDTDGTHIKVEEINTSVTSSVKSDESFTKNVAVDENKFNISFTADEITSSTQHCGVTLTASTTPTANGYSIVVSPTIPIEIPCTGENNVHFATINGDCSSDVEIGDVTGVTSAIIDEGNKVMVNFGHSGNAPTTNVQVNFKIKGDDTILTIEQEYTRSSCGFTPTITPDNTCGVFWYNESWDNAQNVVYHPYQTT